MNEEMNPTRLLCLGTNYYEYFPWLFNYKKFVHTYTNSFGNVSRSLQFTLSSVLQQNFSFTVNRSFIISFVRNFQCKTIFQRKSKYFFPISICPKDAKSLPALQTRCSLISSIFCVRMHFVVPKIPSHETQVGDAVFEGIPKIQR